MANPKQPEAWVMASKAVNSAEFRRRITISAKSTLSNEAREKHSWLNFTLRSWKFSSTSAMKVKQTNTGNDKIKLIESSFTINRLVSKNGQSLRKQKGKKNRANCCTATWENEFKLRCPQDEFSKRNTRRKKVAVFLEIDRGMKWKWKENRKTEGRTIRDHLCSGW